MENLEGCHMDQHNSIFREKSLKSMASPEELDDYIKVTNPGVWLLLTAVIVFLSGVIAWGVFGKLETDVDAFGRMEEGRLVVYTTGSDMLKLKEGMKVVTRHSEGSITGITGYTIISEEVFPTKDKAEEYHIAAGTPLYPIITDLTLPDGNYDTRVVLQEIKPMELIFN